MNYDPDQYRYHDEPLEAAFKLITIHATTWTSGELNDLKQLEAALAWNDKAEYIKVVRGCTHQVPCERGDFTAPCNERIRGLDQ